MEEEGMDNINEDLALALADIEILQSAYPDEIRITSIEKDANRKQKQNQNYNNNKSSFPLHITLQLSDTAYIVLELIHGYPTKTNIQIAKYRSNNTSEYTRLEKAVTAVRDTANICLQDGIEGGLACCASAFDAWNDYEDDNIGQEEEEENTSIETRTSLKVISCTTQKNFHWISSIEPLIDRKSTFIAHACKVQSEEDVRIALFQLLNGNSKLQRATHNMYAYRFTESIVQNDDDHNNNKVVTTILKHDNDDDGEHGAGGRLAHLLHSRNEDGVLIVVSRWYGGILLGPKRFAHITNIARDLLIFCHNNELWK